MEQFGKTIKTMRKLTEEFLTNFLTFGFPHFLWRIASITIITNTLNWSSFRFHTFLLGLIPSWVFDTTWYLSVRICIGLGLIGCAVWPWISHIRCLSLYLAWGYCLTAICRQICCNRQNGYFVMLDLFLITFENTLAWTINLLSLVAVKIIVIFSTLPHFLWKYFSLGSRWFCLQNQNILFRENLNFQFQKLSIMKIFHISKIIRPRNIFFSLSNENEKWVDDVSSVCVWCGCKCTAGALLVDMKPQSSGLVPLQWENFADHF